MANLIDGRRYSCFTKEQQKLWNGLTRRQQNYIILRSQAVPKGEAYRSSGYKPGKQDAQNAYKLERDNPAISELLNAMSNHKMRIDAYEEGTEHAKAVDKKAVQEIVPQFELPVVADDAPKESNIVKPDELTIEGAKRERFYRQIANGTIKTVVTTNTYDKDGNLTGKKVVETSDLETRMKARKELDRILGVQDCLNIGQIQAGNISITIVDASKKELGLNDKKDIDMFDAKEKDGVFVVENEGDENGKG